MSDDWEFGMLDSMAEEDDPLEMDALLEEAALELLAEAEDEEAFLRGLAGEDDYE